MNTPHTPRSAPLARWLRGVLALALAALAPLSGWAQCKLQVMEIPVTMVGTRAVATLRINGTEAPMMVDSGAFASVLTAAAAAQLKLNVAAAPREFAAIGGVAGVAYTQMTRVERLGLQGAELRDVDFLVGGNEPGAHTLGLLGRNLLSIADTEYDLANGAVRLITPNGACAGADMAYWSGSTPVSVVPLLRGPRDWLPSIRARVLLNGEPITALFDTGASSILTLKAARRAGLAGEGKVMQPAGKVYGVGQGELPSWLVHVEDFQVGGERITNGRLRVADMALDGIDMLIGIDFFLSHRIYISKQQDRMFFTYTGGPVLDLSIKTATPGSAAADESTPQDAAAFARRGAVRSARREYALALEDFDRACALEPTGGAYFRRRAGVRLQLAQNTEAAADLDQALRLDPTDDTARLARASLSIVTKNPPSALADLRTLDGRLAPQAHQRRRVGVLYLQLDEPALALPQFNQWIDSHADEVDLHEVLNQRCWARALTGTGLDKALADCNAALDAKPDQAEYLDSRGLVHLRQGEFYKARADYDKALKQRPRLAWSLLGRGLARLRMDEREGGLADLAAARAIQPTIDAEARRFGLELP